MPASRDVLATYERPLRRAALVTWRAQPRLRGYTALAVVLGVGGVVGALAVSPLLWLVAAVGGMVAVGASIGWLGALARTGWRDRARRGAGAGRPRELAVVRARRPQAGAEDLRLGHEQFAVTVEDDGWLITWRFRPLAVDAAPGENEIEVPGRPRYAASAVEDAPFDVRDAARAAEQLVAAQQRAAEREAAAAVGAHPGIPGPSDPAEHAAEARSTAAALREATGQREGRRGRGLRRRDR